MQNISKDIFPTSRLLIAVSGGLDSSVLAHYFHKKGHHIELAHVNFGLRGDESDRDQAFVETMAKELNVPLHVKKEKYEVTFGNVQVWARRVRYDFFEELRQSESLDYTLTAHHLDDWLETSLQHFIEGTGLAGVRSIEPMRGHIVRPLLEVSRKNIEDYAKIYGIKHVEDSSNQVEKYLRNRIRHQIIPAIEKVFPEWQKGVTQTKRNLLEAELVHCDAIDHAYEKCCELKSGFVLIDIDKTLSLSSPISYLLAWLKPYGFNHNQILEITGTSGSQSGKVVSSHSHHCMKDRNHWWVYPMGKREVMHEIHKENLKKPIVIEGFLIALNDPNAPAHMVLDSSKLTFPLKVRNWVPGDRFQPAGMKGSKKVSDFLIDSKVPIPVKDQTLVLVNGNGDIMAVLGWRADERYFNH